LQARGQNYCRIPSVKQSNKPPETMNAIRVYNFVPATVAAADPESTATQQYFNVSDLAKADFPIAAGPVKAYYATRIKQQRLKNVASNLPRDDYYYFRFHNCAARPLNRDNFERGDKVAISAKAVYARFPDLANLIVTQDALIDNQGRPALVPTMSDPIVVREDIKYKKVVAARDAAIAANDAIIAECDKKVSDMKAEAKVAIEAAEAKAEAAEAKAEAAEAKAAAAEAKAEAAEAKAAALKKKTDSRIKIVNRQRDLWYESGMRNIKKVETLKDELAAKDAELAKMKAMLAAAGITM